MRAKLRMHGPVPTALWESAWYPPFIGCVPTDAKISFQLVSWIPIRYDDDEALLLGVDAHGVADVMDFEILNPEALVQD